MFGINGLEFIVLGIIAVLVIGPERLPEYAAQLGRLVKELRRMATGARQQFKDEVGSEFADVDWQKLDPRQYDPRRIIREALLEDNDDPAKPQSPNGPSQQGSSGGRSSPAIGAGAAGAGAVAGAAGAARGSTVESGAPGGDGANQETESVTDDAAARDADEADDAAVNAHPSGSSAAAGAGLPTDARPAAATVTGTRRVRLERLAAGQAAPFDLEAT